MEVTWGVGVGVGVVVLVSLVAALAAHRVRSTRRKGVGEERFGLVLKRSPFEPGQHVEVARQVGGRRDSVAEGVVAGLRAPRRVASTGCLREESEVSELTKCPSSSCLNTEGLHDAPASPSPLRCPFVEFTLVWSTSNATLSVYVIRLTSLPPKYSGCSCSLAVTLERPNTDPDAKTKIETKTSQRLRGASLNPNYSEVFTFADVDGGVVGGSVLVFEVVARRQGRFLNRSVGEARVPLASMRLKADIPATATQPLSLRKKEAVSPGEGVWGEVQVLAQYKVTGVVQGRLKLVVLRGQSTMVASTKQQPGVEYWVEVVCKRGSETTDVQTTKGAPGPNPVWHCPFLFDIPNDKVSDYRLELRLVRSNMLKRRSTLGHAYLGLNTTPTGTQHWHRITVRAPEREITMWHPVAPD